MIYVPSDLEPQRDPAVLAKALDAIAKHGPVPPKRLGWLLWHRRDRAARATAVARVLRNRGAIRYQTDGPGRTGWAVTKGET
jgi:hypothetical protein